MKVSKLVTRIILRVFFILVAVAAFIFFQGDQSKYQRIYFRFTHTWQMIFPAIIILSFLLLLVTCAVKKFNDLQLNWLLVVNTIIVLAYGIAIFIKVSHTV